MLGIIAIIIFTIYTFKSARDYGRNGFLWALINFCVGFGIQVVAPLLIGIVLAVVYMASGGTADQVRAKIDGFSFIVGILATILSLIAMALVLKFVTRVRDGVEIPPAKRAGSLGLGD